DVAVSSTALVGVKRGDGRSVGGHLAKGWRSWRSTGGGHPPPAGAAPLPCHFRLPRTRHEGIKKPPALGVQPSPPWHAQRPRRTCRIVSRPTVNSRYLLSVLVDESAEDLGQVRRCSTGQWRRSLSR